MSAPQVTETRTEQERITGRAGVVAAGTLASRVLGLVREQLLAAMFTRAATDVFFVAFLIPNVLRQLFAEGAVQTGVLPVLTRVEEQQGKERAQSFFAALRGLSLLLLVLVTIVGIVSAPWLVTLFAGGYRGQPGQFERTVSVTQWVFPYILFMGTAALGTAALNSRKRFVVAAFAPGLLNVAFILCAWFLPERFTALGIDPLHALSVGVLLGGALQVIAQWPSLRKEGYLSRPRLKLSDPDVRQVLRRMTPTLFGFGIYYIDVVVARHLLSDLGLGAQSYFAFAQRLCDFPQGIFVMAVQSATLPTLARLVARDDKPELIATFGHGVRLSLFVAIPAAVLLVTLAEPIVRLIFEYGHFDAESTQQTARALVAQASGLWLVSLVRQLVIVFYALGDTRTPVWISALDFGAFVLAALVLRASAGHVGISWAMSLASFVQVLLLGVALWRRLGGLDLGRTVPSALKIGAAAAGAAGAVLGFMHFSAGVMRPNLAAPLACAMFGVIFLLLAKLLRCPELSAITAPLTRRLGVLGARR